jgi:GDPmannose 4,6-dehydratase
LIVGSDGQDGRLLWSQLEEQNCTTVGLSRDGTKALACAPPDFVDIRDRKMVRRVVVDFQPDRIFFLAAHHHSSQDSGSRDDDVWTFGWEVNVEAFRHFLEAVRITGMGARIFYASSSRVFGVPTVSPQTESTPIRPACLYGISKAAAMMLARYYREAHGLWVSCGILYNHESPLRGESFISQRVANTLVAIKHGACNRLEIGDLNARVDWGYAPDYTIAMQLILNAANPDDFVIATGETHTVREMVEIAADYLDLDWTKVVIENPRLLQRSSLPLCGDASHLRQRTGWRPSINFKQLIRLLVQSAEHSRGVSSVAGMA